MQISLIFCFYFCVIHKAVIGLQIASSTPTAKIMLECLGNSSMIFAFEVLIHVYKNIFRYTCTKINSSSSSLAVNKILKAKSCWEENHTASGWNLQRRLYLGGIL